LRSLKREAETLTSGDGDRYIDFGVEIRTVKKSEEGRAPTPGLPKVVEIAEPLRFGGKLDTLTRRFVGPCDNYRVWYVGERQRGIIEMFLDENANQNTLLYSAEGGGKTVLMGMLAWIFIMNVTAKGQPGSIGALAPTHKRLGTLKKAMTDLAPVGAARNPIPGSWGTYFTDASDIVTKSGHTIQLRSTKMQSAATGSAIQGYSWLGAIIDELQDCTEAYHDIAARLRAAKRSQIVGSATAKDNAAWRTWRGELSDNWSIERIKYTETPFVHDSHWKMLKEECTEREWQRRALAMDVSPEAMVYSTFDKVKNLRAIPVRGARDVTSQVLSHNCAGANLLIGFDPGLSVNSSVFLKAYRRQADDDFAWYIVDEVVTHGTTEKHIRELLTKVRRDYGCNLVDRRGRPEQGSPLVHVRADPYGDRANDNSTDRTVYTQFRKAGIQIKAAAYSNKTGKPATISKEAGIEMVCRLFCNVNGTRKLFVALDENGTVKAKKTLESIELSERDAAGKAENEKKGTAKDLSHYTAALRYALWGLEKPRMKELG